MVSLYATCVGQGKKLDCLQERSDNEEDGPNEVRRSDARAMHFGYCILASARFPSPASLHRYHEGNESIRTNFYITVLVPLPAESRMQHFYLRRYRCAQLQRQGMGATLNLMKNSIGRILTRRPYPRVKEPTSDISQIVVSDSL
jgi:hypothetical protein